MPSKHIVASMAVSAIFLSLSKSLAGALACFLSGILIDLDHALDFILIRKKMFNSFRELKSFCLDKSGKVYLLFHSYELLALLWVFAVLWRVPSLYLGFLYGMSIHLLLDQITNTIYPLTYFLVYRKKLGFPKALFFRGQVEEFDRVMARR